MESSREKSATVISYRPDIRAEEYQIWADCTIQVNCWNAVILVSSNFSNRGNFAFVYQATRMSTTPTTATAELQASDGSQSYSGWLWQRWRRKRKRDRARNLAIVRFRLTREGWHFLFVLLFIFVGAVIREINLLILLAGTMIGLLNLQWRFNTKTLQGLKVRRRLPLRTMVGAPTDISIEVTNTRRWLGSWLVLAEDQIQKIQPNFKRLTEKGVALVDEVQPQRTNSARYELRFLERGRYRIGSTTISTRFPIGLGRGWRVIDNSVDLMVHPHLGKLLPACRLLLQAELEGTAKAVPRASVHEGEFYGLRNWQTGDSRRWIHWRTTAKRGELSVRQFEQLQRRQLSVLLDLYQPKSKPTKADRQAIERTVAFAATLASELVNRDRDRIAFAIAGEIVHVLPNVQSAVLVHDLLDRLSEVRPGATPNLVEAVTQISLSLMRSPVLLVVSTRTDQFGVLRQELEDGVNHRFFDRLQVRWLNVSSGELEDYFEWNPPT